MDLRNNTKLAICNVRSFLKYKFEIINSVNDNKLDILLISETHFSENIKVSISGYKMIRADAPKRQ